MREPVPINEDDETVTMSLFPIQVDIETISKLNIVLSDDRIVDLKVTLDKPIIEVLNKDVVLDFSAFGRLGNLAIVLAFLGGLTLVAFPDPEDPYTVASEYLCGYALVRVPFNEIEGVLKLRQELLTSFVYTRLFLDRCSEDKSCSRSREFRDLVETYSDIVLKMLEM